MKRFLCILLAVLTLLSVFAGCEKKEEVPFGRTDSVKQPETGEPTAVVGYYDKDADKKKSHVEGIEYLNLFATKIYYMTPNTKLLLPFDGRAEDWLTKSPLIKTEVSDGKLYGTASECGYLYFTNINTGEEVKVYVNEPVEKDEKRKQRYDFLPYYLYFEKSTYVGGDYMNKLALTVYTVDSEGYYTVPYVTLPSSCGSTPDKTPVGTFWIGGADLGKYTESQSRERWHDWGGGFGQYVIQYSSKAGTKVYLHGPAFGITSVDRLMQDNYNAVGTHCSGGCLRMQTGSAYWVWCNCPNGTTLEIVNGNPRGTCIEKPEKINGLPLYDPTDPALVM